MPKVHKKAILIILSILLIVLTGCYDSREISDTAYVAMLGIDEGIGDVWQISFLIPFFGNKDPGGSGGDEESKDTTQYNLYTFEAPTFFEGVSMLNTFISKKVIFMHANIIVFSEALARNGKIAEFISPLVRNREIRRTEFVVVSKNSAKSFLEAASLDLETSITKEMEDLIKGSTFSGYYPKTDLNDLNNGIKSSYHQTLAIYGATNYGREEKKPYFNTKDIYAGSIPRKGGGKIELGGSAVINGDIMVGKLSGQETRMVLLSKGKLKKAVFSVPDPKKPDLIVPMEIRPIGKPKVKISFEGEEPIIDLKLKLKGDILAIQSTIDYEDPKLIPVLEKAVEEFIKGELDRTSRKIIDLETDVFDFGLFAARHFSTIQEWEEYNWNKHFKNADINTTVEFQLKRTGTMISSSPIISSKGDEKDR